VQDPSLGRVAGDFFASVMLVVEAGEAGQVDPSTLRGQLVTQLDAISKHPVAAALEPMELEDARFALAAWADELLVGSAWPGAGSWSSELLQTRLFRTNRGGDEFYERLGRLRPDQNAARQIYFLCFCFGFEGQLIGQEPERRALMQQHYDMLRAAGKARDLVAAGQLSPEAYQLEVHLEPPASGSLVRILSRWGLLAAGVLGVLWAVLAVLARRVPLPPDHWLGG
jgi:type IV/VI secretion system ImpK/VasF family protein